MKHLFSTILFILILFKSFSQVSDSSQREIKLQGAVNFRDIGGYKTKNGKVVKMHLLYRSAALNTLTNQDLLTIDSLGIKYDFDFRGPYEVKVAEDRIPNTTIRISLPAGSENIGDSAYMKNMGQLMKSDKFILNFYTDLAPFKYRYAPLFDSLVANQSMSPILFHCTAGKDRTGIAAALILYALGVDEKTIYDDYEATNYYRKRENEKAIVNIIKFYGTNEQVAVNLMSAKREYIEATFNTIRAKYGTIENYLNEEMGLNRKKIIRLQKIFTK
jgi:protein-tyrosine phosphatase